MEENQIHSSKHLRKSIRGNCCNFLVMFTVHSVVVTAAAFGFFYLEHCFQVSDDKEVQQQQTINNTSINTQHQSNTTNNSSTGTQFSEKGWRLKCEMKRVYIFMWLEYSMTVATTIGL